PTLFFVISSTLFRVFSNSASTSYFFVCGQTVHGSLNYVKLGRGFVYQTVYRVCCALLPRVASIMLLFIGELYLYTIPFFYQGNYLM
ncbi:MAG: hypothetical protein ACKPKO_23685, partial [Candidatus Fonsibacter sp.]